jgi:hypothetical protein
MPIQALPRLRLKAFISAIAVALPVAFFYSILLDQASEIPIYDDYRLLLGFVNEMVELKTFSAKASYFLAAQHNEYKLFFAHGVVWLQFAALGHVNMRLLCAIGNGFALLLGMLLWKMFLPNHKDIASRLMYFIPVSWLLFQLQFIETLNWATGSLQNLPVLFFSLGAIYLLVSATPREFFGALVFLILAIASNGNGLLMIPIGILILALDRRYGRIVPWLVVSAGCVAAYAHKYNIMSSQSPVHPSIFSTLRGLRPLFVIVFIGNAVAFPIRAGFLGISALLCPFLGAVVCTFLFYLVRRGYFRRNPLVCYCVLFLLLTSVGAAGLRSDLGLMQSLTSRYGIFSALLLIFAWFAIVEEFLLNKSVTRRNRILISTIAFSVVFALIMDAGGWHYSVVRKRELFRGMAVFEHSASPESTAGPILPLPNQPASSDLVDLQARAILIQSIKLGVYQPPVL